MKKILQLITGGLIKDVGKFIDTLTTDSFLSKNIRPMVLIYLTVVFTILSFFDGNVGEFKIAEQYVPIFQSLLITVYGAYFVGRTWEKSKKNK